MDSYADLSFVRHAAVDCSENGHPVLCGGRYDVPLSDEGQRQVHLLRQRLTAERRFDAVYTSPLQRALQTTAAAPAPVVPVQVLGSLAEIDCGAVDGLPIDDVRLHHPELWLENEAQTNEDFSWPGGESYRQFRRRVLRAIEGIARAHAGQRVLIVTHAGVINQALGSITGQSAARWESPRPRNASLTRVTWGSGGAAIESFDDCRHLEDSAFV